jgi:hypothetical protein
LRYDSLPGRAFPGDPDAYPGRDDVVAYLSDYARDFELPVELDTAAHALTDPRVRGLAHESGRFEMRRVPRTPNRLAVPHAGTRERAPGPIAQQHEGDVMKLDESSVTFAFVVVAAAAITGSPRLLVAGLAGHGLKDLCSTAVVTPRGGRHRDAGVHRRPCCPARLRPAGARRSSRRRARP